MPVVIDYSPVGSIAAAAQNVWSNNRPQQSFSRVQLPDIDAEHLPGDMQDLGNGQSVLYGANGQQTIVQSPNYNPAQHPGAQQQVGGVDQEHLNADGSLSSRNYYAGPDSEPAQAAQAAAGTQRVPVQLSTGQTVKLKPEAAATYDLQNTRDDTSAADKAARLKLATQKANTQVDQFGQTMQARDADRQQRADAAATRVKTMLDLATQKNLDAGQKQQLNLAMKVHASIIQTAQERLQTAKSALSSQMSNNSFDKAAVDKAQKAVTDAQDAYDAAQKDLQDDVEEHITKLQGVADQPQALPLAQQHGAINLKTDDDAKAYLRAAGQGKVASQDDVTAAMQQAKGDKAKAMKLLTDKGFVFTRSGIKLEAGGG
jgi:hypothetical protein